LEFFEGEFLSYICTKLPSPPEDNLTLWKGAYGRCMSVHKPQEIRDSAGGKIAEKGLKKDRRLQKNTLKTRRNIDRKSGL
ncbi:MAG: hypothetical protein J6E42_00685, partial [Firmicutes bacterium]|nr:hypothetical protein [Bacillota bacterium]